MRRNISHGNSKPPVFATTLHEGTHCQVVAYVEEHASWVTFELQTLEGRRIGTHKYVTDAVEEADVYDRAREVERYASME